MVAITIVVIASVALALVVLRCPNLCSMAGTQSATPSPANPARPARPPERGCPPPASRSRTGPWPCLSGAWGDTRATQTRAESDPGMGFDFTAWRVWRVPEASDADDAAPAALADTLP